jgi:hypothetical protein
MSEDKQVEGKLRFRIELSVSADEMKTWHPERIAAFFAGLARVIRARDGLPETVKAFHR